MSLLILTLFVYVGHFLLTLLLLDKMKEKAPSRIINISSLAHLRGRIDFDDLNSSKVYSSFSAYSQSKLANILFTFHLAKLLKGLRLSSVILVMTYLSSVPMHRTNVE